MYPDALVTHILSASTYPDQVAAAEYWIQQNKNLTGSALMQAVDTQSLGCAVGLLFIAIGGTRLMMLPSPWR